MTKTTFTVTLDTNKTEIQLKNKIIINIFEKVNDRFSLTENEIFFLSKKNQIQLIGNDKSIISKLEFDHVILLNTSEIDLDLNDLTNYLIELAMEAGLKLANQPEPTKIPVNIKKACARELEDTLQALSAFGYRLEKKKYVAAKAQHRWKKSLSDIEFHLERQGASATVIWPKSNQLIIKAGAKLVKETPLNKDGSIGFAARFTLTLREENKDKWNTETYLTTSDITLKSVNEMGHFLYFAGTNSWLELFTADGQSLHELSVVK